MEKSGFIVLDRALLDWQWHDNVAAMSLWIHILLKANWRDGWFMGTLISRGSFATSIRNLADETGMHPNTIRKWLKRFKSAGQIELKSTNRFTQIIVINYAKFQDLPDDYVKQRVKQDVKQSVKQRVDNRTNKQRNNKTNKESHRAESSKSAEIPTLEDVLNYVAAHSKKVDGSRFFNYYNARGWKIKGDQVTDWKSLLDSWEDKDRLDTASGKKKNQTVPDYMIQDYTDPDDGGKPSDGELDELKALMERLR